MLVPVGWSLKHSGEELQLTSESGDTAVTVTTYRRRAGSPPVNSANHLHKFLSGEHPEKCTIINNARERASAEYSKTDGSQWHALFLENKNALLLATANTTLDPAADEFVTAKKVVESIVLK